jgi:D-inositol-3-phosphate glycosyltransferase
LNLNLKKFNNRIALIEPSGGYSGMQYYNIGMFNGLQFNGVKPYLFTTSSENLLNNNRIFFFNYFDKVWTSKSKILKLYFYFFGLFKSIIKAKREKCRVVHLHQFHLNFNLVITVAISKLFFNKLLLTVHDVESFNENNNRYKIFFTFLLNYFVDNFIVHNKFSSSQLSKTTKTNPVIIRHGSYVPFFKALPYVSCNKKLRLLFFGLVKESKGLDVLLESLIILKNLGVDFQLTIAGRPWRNDFTRYQKIIDDYNLENSVTKHLFFISESDLVNHFNDSHLVVLPYRKIFQSGVVLKAMSFKRPILCSSLPAFEEIIIDGFNGFIFESENPLSLANKLKEIFYESEKLKDIVENAYKILEEDFNWNDIGLKLKNLYTHTYEK